MLKTCSKCKAQKDLDSFHNSKRSKDGKQHRCKSCAKHFTQEATKVWRKANEKSHRLSIRKTKAKLKYGLNLDEINKLLEAQNNCCAICKKELSFSAVDKSDKPHIDHCHITGIVRGILCLQCNTGIGMFGDSSNLLSEAKSYLDNQRERLSELAPKGDAIVRSHENSNHERLAEMTNPTIH